MPISDNPFRSRVTLDATKLTITIEIVKKETATEKESVVETGVYDAHEVHENIRNNVALYGLSKLLQDRASDTPVGPEKIKAMNAVMDNFRAGTWTAERKAGAPIVSPEVEAIAELKSATVAEIQATLKTYTQAQKDSIFANARVKAKADEIRARRQGAAPVDLGDLGGLTAEVADAA